MKAGIVINWRDTPIGRVAESASIVPRELAPDQNCVIEVPDDFFKPIEYISLSYTVDGNKDSEPNQ